MSAFVKGFQHYYFLFSCDKGFQTAEIRMRVNRQPQYLPRTPCGISHCCEKGKISGDCFAVQSHGTLTPAPSLWPGRELRKYHYPLRVSLPTKEQPCLSCGISACPTGGVMAYRRRARPAGNVPDILYIQFSGGVISDDFEFTPPIVPTGKGQK